MNPMPLLSRSKHLLLLSLTIVAMTSCTQEPEESKETLIDNILLMPWTGSYGGVPAFDQMKVADVKAAMLQGMELNLEDIDAIANNTEPPTFENTIVEMERAGEELSRGSKYYGILSSNQSSPEFRDIQTELAPLFSEFRSKISQNEKLFQRIKAVYDASQITPLPADQQRVVDLTYKEFEMDGAELDKAKKERYAAINKELSSLYTEFSNNVLHDEENYVTYLTEEQLGGLSVLLSRQQK
jgi:peptidyl-dipeptidase Dcp